MSGGYIANYMLVVTDAASELHQAVNGPYAVTDDRLPRCVGERRKSARPRSGRTLTNSAGMQ